MRMTAVEKHFVNRPAHTAVVARHALELLDKICIEPGWSYLDAGCGTGAAAHAIAATHPLRVTGVDLDPHQIESARNRGARPNLEFHIMDATGLTFPCAHFDIVSTAKATHHIPHWERAFAELARVLRPGGYFIYSDLVVPHWLSRIATRLIPLAGYPSIVRLDSLARQFHLTPIFRAHGFATAGVIWRKSH